MQAFKLKIFLLFIFIIANGHSCEEKVDCHKFKVQISYDGVEQLTAQPINGLAPFVFKWSHNLGSGSIAYIPGAGSYSITVTDLNKCSAIGIFNVQ